MILRWIIGGLLLLSLGLNTLDGAGKIAAFYYRHRGEKELARAELSLALKSLAQSLRWESEDAPSYILTARVHHLSQTNSIPLAGFEKAKPEEMLSRGVGALAAAISRNPADPWAWFNLGESYKAYQTKRLRFDKLKAAAEAAVQRLNGGPARGAAVHDSATTEDFQAVGGAVAAYLTYSALDEKTDGLV